MQWVWAAILGFGQRMAEHAAAVRNGGWLSNPDFCFYDGRLREFAADVLCDEPPRAGSPAWATLEARQRLLDITARNLAGFLDGSPLNAVTA